MSPKDARRHVDGSEHAFVDFVTRPGRCTRGVKAVCHRMTEGAALAEWGGAVLDK